MTTSSQEAGPSVALDVRVKRLPIFGRLYRNSFRSGNSRGTALGRVISRILYYTHDALRLPTGSGVMEVVLRGSRRQIRFDVRNRQFHSIYFDKYIANGYEPQVASLIRALLPGDGVLFDIGANWGYFSLLAASRDEFSGHIHAFEPWPSSFRDLESTIDQANLAEVVTCHQLALSDRTGTAQMHCGRHSGLASIRDSSGGVPVKCTPLDDLDLDEPDVIKMDVEGGEESILRGASRLLHQVKPHVILEQRVEADSFVTQPAPRLLTECGYELFAPALEVTDTMQNRRRSFGYGTRGDRVASDVQLFPIREELLTQFSSEFNLLACHRDRLGEIDRYRTDSALSA